MKLNNLRIETAGTEEEAAEGIGQGTADGGCVGQEKRGIGRGWRESTGTGSPRFPHSGCRAKWNYAR